MRTHAQPWDPMQRLSTHVMCAHDTLRSRTGALQATGTTPTLCHPTQPQVWQALKCETLVYFLHGLTVVSASSLGMCMQKRQSAQPVPLPDKLQGAIRGACCREHAHNLPMQTQVLTPPTNYPQEACTLQDHPASASHHHLNCRRSLCNLWQVGCPTS